MLHTLTQDLRFAARMLRKRPFFTVVAVLVIALGVGAVTTIFSAMNAILLRPLPGVRDPGTLDDIVRTQGNGQGSLSPSYPYYRRLAAASHSMRGIAAWALVRLTISTGAEAINAAGNLVSGNYFDVLGATPALGRFFAAEEDSAEGAHPVVVVSYGLWQRQYGGDPGVLGRTLVVNGTPLTVIGVAPAGFSGTFPVIRTDAWVPLAMQAQIDHEQSLLRNPNAGWLALFGRRRASVTREVAQAELAGLTKRMAGTDGENADFRDFSGARLYALSGLPVEARTAVRAFMALLLAVSALVLLIASVNVASMLLARALGRRREMAVWVALGAGRLRLVRQLLTESLLLFGLGAAGGVVLAVWGTRLLAGVQLPVDMPLALHLSPDGRVLVFALGLALVTGLVFGLAPALQATRLDIATGLHSDTAGAGRRRSRLRDTLVIGQMALSLLLLMAAGLFTRALGRAQRVDPGFTIDGVATAAFNLRTAGYDSTRSRRFFEALTARLTALPGVTAVGFARFLPLSGTTMANGFTVDGYTPPASQRRPEESVMDATVDGGYFAALQLPIVQGRAFAPTDGPAAPAVAVVNEAFVRRYWRGLDPIGRTLKEGGTTITVVGVARDAKYASLAEPPTPFLYLPLSQRPQDEQTLLVRLAGDPAAIAPAIRRVAHTLDPRLPVPTVASLRQVTAAVLLPQRVAAGVTGVMGAIGLLLAAVGLYGIVAYAVGQRTREIGLRMALGASRAGVLALILREGLKLAAVGIAIGLVLAAVMTRLMRPFLFGVNPLDPVTVVTMTATLLAVAVGASYFPARRASAADPMSALRSE
jgi:putative ABC transport system permease protein